MRSKLLSAVVLVCGSLGVGCAEPQPARTAADVWLVDAPTPLDGATDELNDEEATAGSYKATEGQAVRPRLRETKVLGVSEYGPAPTPEEPVYDAAPASEVYDAGATTYGVGGYVRGYSSRSTSPAVIRSSRGGSTGTSSTPPVGGNWPAVPSYGPTMLGDHSKH